MTVKVGELSKAFFCPTCGAPARKARPPRGSDYWTTSCPHAARPVRMGVRQRQQLRVERPEVRRAIADCAGEPIVGDVPDQQP